MTAPELLATIESIGGVLSLDGDRIHYELPEDAAPMIEVLRQCRDEVVGLLRGRERPQECSIHKARTTWWTLPDGAEVCGRCHPDPYAVALEAAAQADPPPMPPGVRLLQWAPVRPPVAIESWAVVTDVPQFIHATLIQLQTAMSGENWLAGNRSVHELIDRLEQVGVQVSVEGTR